jgi:hypothetical protein
VSFGFTVENLEDWTEEARSRGVEFLSAPADEGFGLTAEIRDPEGNVVVVREPMSEETLEERLAEAWEEDEVPHQAAMRSPVRKATRHSSWVAVKPDYKTAKKAAKSKPALDDDADPDEKPLPERAKDVASARGTDPVRTRQKAKTLAGPKRPRIRSAIGRLKKAEARTLDTAKKAAADASKRKPIKRAASKRGKAATKKAGAKRRRA